MRTNKIRSVVAMSLLALSTCDGQSPQTAASDARSISTEGSRPHAHETHAEHDHTKHVLPAAAALSTESIYHASTPLTDQNGRAFELGSLRGSVVLATMFYASCTSVCPMLIAQLERIVDALPSDARAQTHVLLVSLDPQRDNPESLRQLAERHKITDPNWHFVRTESDGVREVAALLGVRYRQLPGNEISHSQVIVLLDQNGVIIERMENAAGDSAQLLAATTHAARTGSSHAAR
ncbi:MAG TPA: SCO family protein [Polyangiales bacterium]|nr:SCO family protein [Polyangiales bacterium]